MGLFLFDFARVQRNLEVIPYSQFNQLVLDGKVADANIAQERIEGTLKDPLPGRRNKQFMTQRVDDADLFKRLSEAGVRFSGVRESTWFRDIFSWMIPGIFLIGLLMLLMNRMSQVPRSGGMLPIGKSKAKIYVEKDLATKFDDVAGVDEAKEELREVVNFLKDPKRYSRLGGRMPKGVMLVGPPGTGKTLLARAVAGEAKVPFFSINGSEFVELFVGLGAARVRDLFQQARAQSPCIVFIDELDALGKARGLNAITGSSNDEKEQTLNQLLAELDGFDPSVGIVLIASTNRPEILDPALLRAGRFDRQILVDRPDRQGRFKILQVHMKKVTMAAEVQPETLASLTAGFSGADLANLVNEAALIATRRGAESVELRDFTGAIERVIAGLERKSRLLHPDEKRRVAYHEMGHAVVALTLGEGEEVHKVSIIPRGIGALGYTLRRPTEDRYLMNKRDIEGKLAIAMGGRAAEAIFFSDISTGAADDLDKATEIARAMVTRYGMSDALGLTVLEREQAAFLGGQGAMRAASFSERTAQAIDDEIRRILNHAMAVAIRVVRQQMRVIEDGVRLLLLKETIDEQELKDIWKRNQQPVEAGISAVPGPSTDPKVRRIV